MQDKAQQEGARGAVALPHWNLDPIYPGYDSKEYARAKARLSSLCVEAEAHLTLQASSATDIAAWLVRALELEEEIGSVYATLSAYTYARYSTATRDPVATGELNAVETLGLPVKRLAVLFRNALAARRDAVLALASTDPRIGVFAFHLEEEIRLQSKQMSPELEDLASDLLRSGGDAWGRLQQAVSSNTSVVWDAATGERKTIVQLRNLAFDEDRLVREKAWRLELEAWKEVEVPVAAALNGVKGFTVSLDGRRGWASPLDKAIEQARITRRTLDALVTAMEDSLPSWRRYLAAKAPLVGAKKLAFYDLFAPVGNYGAGTGAGGAPSKGGGSDSGGGAGGAAKKWSFPEARDFIVDKFGGFDPAMGAFADRAFREGWIDAEPREGKVGGAYCIDFPDAKSARVLCNYDDSFSAMTTVAHELGHAWHHECIKDRPLALTQYPMTLAETASIFAETIVFEGAIKAAAPAQRIGLIEGRLQDGCQVIVDILSRFQFEKAVFERRATGELGPEEFSALMIAAQKRCYGEALDPEKLHAYMWAVKGHYYDPGLSFYNFPYAFGLLFGLGLYDRYRSEGPAFAASYRALLAETGSASAVEVTRRAGFDIETPEFWKRGLSVFEKQTIEFEALAKEYED